MSRNVRKNMEMFRALQKMNPQQRSNVLKAADSSLVIAICECALNTLKGNVPMSTPLKRKLSRFKKFLRTLAKNTTSWKRKRKFLVQKGGAIIPLLLGAVLSALTTSFVNRD